MVWFNDFPISLVMSDACDSIFCLHLWVDGWMDGWKERKVFITPKQIIPLHVSLHMFYLPT